MKVSYQWLQNYTDIRCSAQELADIMTFGGIEVEAVHYPGKLLKQIIIARIISKENHPDADKLSVCQVDDGQEIKQVVCGAPNCAVGQKIALAPVGCKLNEIEIKKVKIRGELSLGMICSEKELGISDNHEGIMVLPEDAPLGVDLATYLELQDIIFDTEITPNRPDLLGMIGIARDLAALRGKKFSYPLIKLQETEKSVKDVLELENHESKLCPRYTARVIEQVRVGESPDWLKKALLAVGLRPINNIVDITNFVMMEYGHPLHAFDYDRVQGNKIVVRRARAAEPFPALDDEDYELAADDLVIADTEKPIALAGVIGGRNSHITSDTVTIVLEAANFLYSSIRKTALRHNIATDSSYRFERELSAETADVASRRAASLILELAGGNLLQGKLDSYPTGYQPDCVQLRPSRVKQILSVDISDQLIRSYMERLELRYIESGPGYMVFEIPPFRQDLEREIDLIEEIMRLHGYNNLPTLLKPSKIMDRESIFSRRRVKDILVQNDFLEIINWGFGDPLDLDMLEIPENDLRRNTIALKNPLGRSFSIMRSLLLPNLLKTALFNINHGQKDLKLFELAKVYNRGDQKAAEERYQICGLLCGYQYPVYWQGKDREVDFFYVKGIVEDILEYLDLSGSETVRSSESYYLPGQAADILWQGKKIASLGRLDPKIGLKYDLNKAVYSFEINLSDILSCHRKSVPNYSEILRYPPVLRDISFIVPVKYTLADIAESIRSIDPAVIKQVQLFDEFTGKNIPEGHRSLSFNLVFNSPTKTLTDDFINGIIKLIIEMLQKEFQIEMR
ncbi:MAG: phenylalanine--tRNA ligase subunit beta [Candidatus Cloacimonetes bacterium]|nr:phenylalanine--tRNA ligase subunit beta [Candidatus Cloacimonadota bacterium]